MFIYLRDISEHLCYNSVLEFVYFLTDHVDETPTVTEIRRLIVRPTVLN